MEQVINKIDMDDTSDKHQRECRKSDLHSFYEIKTEEGKTADMEILVIHFGMLCRSALDRLNHGVDGFVIAIYHDGGKFNVFRKLRCENQNAYPKLRLLKNT